MSTEVRQSLKKFFKRILDENPNIDPTKSTDFFRRKAWEAFPEIDDTVEIDSVLYETISEKISEVTN